MTTTALLKTVGVAAICLAGLSMTIAPPTLALSGEALDQSAGSHRSDAKSASGAEVRAPNLGDPILCPVDEYSVPESSSTGVVTEWLPYGETLTVDPLDDRIWAGVWFTPWNGPAGWVGTPAGWDYPVPGVPAYSLVARFGNAPFEYIGDGDRTFTNSTPGTLKRVRFKVNDNVPGNGSGAFRVFVSYPCH